MVADAVLSFDLEAYASPRRSLVEAQLLDYLQEQEPKSLWQSMRYSVLAGGKRFRALLCLATAEAIQGDLGFGLTAPQAALPCACAIEMVHAMSLIHDDLPCMDNDDYRRGKPTNHKVFGEAGALLAGDALLVFATEILLRQTPSPIDRSILIDVAAELARASGPQGMVGGQMSDCIATGLLTDGQTQAAQRDTLEPTNSVVVTKSSCSPAAVGLLLQSIHKRKTGALLRFSCWSGARLMGADEQTLKCLSEYGEILGLAFQIADDLLDLTGDLKSLGKTPGKDQASGKSTWVSVFGIEASKKKLQDLDQEGKSLLMQSGLSSQAIAPLASLLSYAIQRKS